MKKKDGLQELLSAWEETYKKGQLTLWVFLALEDGSKCVDDIRGFIDSQSKGSMVCEEQSLYRNLRKFQHLQIVDFEPGRGNRGPDRKYYFLTLLGKKLLQEFVRRNMLIFFQPPITKLIKRI